MRAIAAFVLVEIGLVLFFRSHPASMAIGWVVVALGAAWTGFSILHAVDDFRRMTGQMRLTAFNQRLSIEGWKASDARYRQVVEQIDEIVFHLDSKGRWTFLNSAWTDITGFTVKESLGKHVLDFVDDRDRDQVRSVYFDSVASELDRERRLHRICTKHGEMRWVDARVRSEKDADGQTVGYFGTLSDVTERKRAEELLAYQAHYDPLTDLPNRTLFMDRLTDTLRRIRDEGRTAAVLFFDLDDFQVINDSIGHTAGDSVLVELSTRLKHALPQGAMLARFGGDEFSILLEEIGSESEVVAAAESMLVTVSRPFAVAGQSIPAAANVGVAIIDGIDQTAEDVVRDAGTALHQAKKSGRTRYAIFDSSMSHQAVERLQMEAELRHAISSGHLDLHYQPIVDLGTLQMVEVEALLRWNHPRLGRVSPARYLPLAEETGLIVPLGSWVLREACTQAARWRERHGADNAPVVNVNVSLRQLRQTNFVAQVRAILEDTGLPASALKLEITESLMMEDPEANIALLEELKSLGVGLAVDDFGTGYSCMAYLMRLPIDTVKIDRAFAKRLGKHTGNDAIVRSMIDLAKSLKMNVTAEGIELRDQLDQLTAMGADHGQGFLFSQAVCVAEVDAFLAGPAGSRATDPAHDDRAGTAPLDRWLMDGAMAARAGMPLEQTVARDAA